MRPICRQDLASQYEKVTTTVKISAVGTRTHAVTAGKYQLDQCKNVTHGVQDGGVGIFNAFYESWRAAPTLLTLSMRSILGGFGLRFSRNSRCHSLICCSPPVR